MTNKKVGERVPNGVREGKKLDVWVIAQLSTPI